MDRRRRPRAVRSGIADPAREGGHGRRRGPRPATKRLADVASWQRARGLLALGAGLSAPLPAPDSDRDRRDRAVGAGSCPAQPGHGPAVPDRGAAAVTAARAPLSRSLSRAVTGRRRTLSGSEVFE